MWQFLFFFQGLFFNMDCTQALDDLQFEDNTPYKEGEKKQVINVSCHIFTLLSNSVGLSDYEIKQILTYFQ